MSVVYPSPSDVVFGVEYGTDGTEFTGTFQCSGPLPSGLVYTPFAAVLVNIVHQVANALRISTSYVRPIETDEYPVTETEDLFAYIRPFAPQPTNPADGSPLPNQGAGRLARVVGRRFRVYVWTRSSEDVVGGDEVALLGTDPDQTVNTPPAMPGLFVAEEIVLDALDDYIPVEGLVNLTLGPVHWIPSESGPPLRKAENDAGLNWSALDFQVVYNLAINVNEPRLALPTPSGA